MAYSKVKTIVVERDGQELEWREEVSPHNDLLQTLGIVSEDILVIAGGTKDPSVDGFPGVEGSVYFSSNGNIYKKTGPNNDNWEIFSGGGGGSQYLKDLLDVDNNLSPENLEALMFDSDINKWTSKPICHPNWDWGLITQPIDCGHYDWGSLT